MLGASLSVTNKLQMACALRAERRWVMTGQSWPCELTLMPCSVLPAVLAVPHTIILLFLGPWRQSRAKQSCPCLCILVEVSTNYSLLSSLQHLKCAHAALLPATAYTAPIYFKHR